jgi:hypothetical protein
VFKGAAELAFSSPWQRRESNYMLIARAVVHDELACLVECQCMCEKFSELRIQREQWSPHLALDCSIHLEELQRHDGRTLREIRLQSADENGFVEPIVLAERRFEFHR